MAGECQVFISNDDDDLDAHQYCDSMENFNQSIYVLLARYLKVGKKDGNYVKGYIDGYDNYISFLEEFKIISRTKYTTRTSWTKKDYAKDENSKVKGRYGREERIYWEYKSGNLTLPFTGVPFVVKMCITKHCQFGQQYYKTTDQRLLEKQQKDACCMNGGIDDGIPPEKKRRNKPSKKLNCPAVMHAREILMFEKFALPKDQTHGLKALKAQKLAELRRLLNEQDQNIFEEEEVSADLFSTRRFYVAVPLPEAHRYHEVGGFSEPLKEMSPEFVQRIDRCLLESANNYDVTKVMATVVGDMQKEFDFISNAQLMDQIAEYIYIHSISHPPQLQQGEEVANQISVIIEDEFFPQPNAITDLDPRVTCDISSSPINEEEDDDDSYCSSSEADHLTAAATFNLPDSDSIFHVLPTDNNFHTTEYCFGDGSKLMFLDEDNQIITGASSTTGVSVKTDHFIIDASDPLGFVGDATAGRRVVSSSSSSKENDYHQQQTCFSPETLLGIQPQFD